MTTDATTAADDRALAKQALEQVCARGDLEAAKGIYSSEFLDHVNDLDFTGHEGIKLSTDLYRSVISDLRIRVDDQVVEGDRVVSRWTAEGTNRGRQICLTGITISRFADGRIAEDWTVSDNLGLLRQLGPWRALRLGADQLVAAVRARRSSG